MCSASWAAISCARRNTSWTFAPSAPATGRCAALERERERTGGLSEPKLGDKFVVHARYGTPCPRCGDTLRRVSYESYEVTYCPACQTSGKPLADRRMSRLVK